MSDRHPADQIRALEAKIEELQARLATREQDLQAFTTRYRALLSASQDAIFLETEDARILDCNELACAMHGYTRDELVGLNAADLVPAEVARTFPQLVEAQRHRGGAFVQAQARRKDGSTFPTEVSTHRLAWDGQSLVIVFVRDVSERQRESNFVSAVLETAGALLMVTDLAGHILRFNPACEQVTGWSAAEMLGRPAWDLFPPDLAGEVQALFHPSRLETIPRQIEADIVSRSGERLTIAWATTLLRRPDGTAEAVVASGLDVTRLRVSQQSLQQHLAWLEVVLGSLEEAVLATNLQGEITFLNARAARMLDLDREATLGRPLKDALHVIDDYRSATAPDPVQTILSTGHLSALPTYFAAHPSDGMAHTYTAAGTPIRDHEGHVVGVVLVLRDVTERHRLRQEITKAQRLEAVAHLAAGIAHDFNNLLTAVLGNVTLARMLSRPGDRFHARLGEAEKALSRAQDLTGQLLSFSRSGSPVRTTSSLTEILHESSALCLRGSSVRCRVDTPADLWPVEVDQGQMAQVMNNLVINADQAMPDGGNLEIRAENLVVSTEDHLPLKPGRYVRVSVTDHGVGIPPEHLPSIFDPYFTTKPKGTGLGLATTWYIVTNHDGYVEATSKVGVGSTFRVYLPASERYLSHQRKPTPAAPARGQGRILVVEDDESVRQVVVVMLRELGYDTEEAADLEEVMLQWEAARLAGNPFDLLLADLTMKGARSGVEIVAHLHRTAPTARAVLMTGYANDPRFLASERHGFKGRVAKPFNLTTLGAAIRQALER